MPSPSPSPPLVFLPLEKIEIVSRLLRAGIGQDIVCALRPGEFPSRLGELEPAAFLPSCAADCLVGAYTEQGFRRMNCEMSEMEMFFFFFLSFRLACVRLRRDTHSKQLHTYILTWLPPSLPPSLPT